jgi:hypothetical protein
MNKTAFNSPNGKAYLVTYVRTHDLDRKATYGIMQAFNKPQSAHAFLKKLIKEQAVQHPSVSSQVRYGLKTVDMNSLFPTNLFEFNY